MSKNTQNSGSLQGLQMGQTLLVSARKVAGQKVQLEYAEVLEKESTPAINLVALFNASDSRFTVGSKARRAWITVQPADAGKLLGIDLSDNNADWYENQLGQEMLDLNILNPVATFGDVSTRLRVQIVETVSPTEYQKANISNEAKRKGKDGAFITHKGFYIFTNATVVIDTPKHVFLESDSTSTTTTTGIPAVSVVADDSPFN
jgi:hypothetical protein